MFVFICSNISCKRGYPWLTNLLPTVLMLRLCPDLYWFWGSLSSSTGSRCWSSLLYSSKDSDISTHTAVLEALLMRTAVFLLHSTEELFNFAKNIGLKLMKEMLNERLHWFTEISGTVANQTWHHNFS